MNYYDLSLEKKDEVEAEHYAVLKKVFDTVGRFRVMSSDLKMQSLSPYWRRFWLAARMAGEP